MKIQAMAMSDPMLTRLETEGLPLTRVEGAQCDMDVVISRVEIQHLGSAERFRPYLHLSGEVQTVVPSEPLADGVDELEFPLGSRPLFDGFYSFDEEQIASLVAKGYFEKDFRVPDKLVNKYELSVTADFACLEREQPEDVPVVFVRLHDLNGMALDKEGSRYDLARHFEDVQQVRAEQQALQAAVIESTPDLTDPEETNRPIRDLFAGLPFPEQEEAATLVDAHLRTEQTTQQDQQDQERPQEPREVVPGERTAQALGEMDAQLESSERDGAERMYNEVMEEVEAERTRSAAAQAQAQIASQEESEAVEIEDEFSFLDEDEDSVMPIQVAPEVHRRVRDSSRPSRERSERARRQALALAEQARQEDEAEQGPSLG